MVFASSVLKVLPLLKALIAKSFAIHQKFAKTAKFFSCVAFVVYGYQVGVPCLIRIYTYNAHDVQETSR